jgi:TolB-like protein
MSSLIEGYNYDIFISYRQKDNKHDGWVTRFVENLRGELEATFKDDISVYFDENPHDRLQETHNVDKSLEGKLKCLIFIPVISQTYCDPKSYAWQHEFLAFLRMAENDRFGKDVILSSGNVASRILPIRIHDLEQEDIKLFEKETGSVLRSMDFVFKTSTGVSRPLRVNEVRPQDNINKTYYADQINKVGHSIKEIVRGLKAVADTPGKEKTRLRAQSDQIITEKKTAGRTRLAVFSKRRLITSLTLLAILIISAILIYPKIFKKDTLEKLRSSGERISIAVMPFQNMTNDTTWNIWQNGIKDNLITNLSNFPKYLSVKQSESVNGVLEGMRLTNYASITPSIAGAVSRDLKAKLFIYGSISRAGSTIRVNTQLVSSKTEEAIKSFQIEGTSEGEIFNIIDSLSGLIKDFLIISVLEKDIVTDFRPLISTRSSEAYRYYMFGNQAFYKFDYNTAKNWFIKAIEIDTNFTDALRMLSYSFLHLEMYSEAKEYCLRLYNLRDQMSPLEKLYADALYAENFLTIYEKIKCWNLILDFDDQMPVPYSNLAGAYEKLHQYDKAIELYIKGLEIYDRWGIKPRWISTYTDLGRVYHIVGKYRKEKILYRRAEKDFPAASSLLYRQAVLALSEKETEQANRYIKKYISDLSINGTSEATITSNLGEIYAEAGILDKAEVYYREALALQYNADRLNTLAYFLIDNDRNIIVGLGLIDEALKLSPGDYRLLHTKGWGLYKQGKYQAALDILQQSWSLRMKNAVYYHTAWLHLLAAKKAVAG